MSKAVKTIVSVVAAIAIPFAAPAIASSIGLSAAIGGAVGSAAAGSVIGGAITGAALGAVKGAVLGEDVGRSALMGGLGGGIGGYTAAPTSAVPQSAITAANATADPIAALNASQGFTGVDQAYLGSITAADPIAVMNAQQGWTTADPTYTAQAAQTPAAGLDTSGLSGATAVPTTAPTAAPGAAPGAAPTGAPKTFSEALSRTGDAIKAKFTDPKAMADLTLRAAGQLAGSALAGSGLSPEEEQLLAAQRTELEQLRQTNQQLFQQRLDQAQSLLGEARYFGPNYFRQQAEAATKISIGRQEQAATRGQTGERRAYTQRQYQLGAARAAPTAGLQAAGQAQQARLQTMQAGLQQIPTSGPSTSYAGLMNMYDTAAKRRRETQEDIGQLFGSFTGGGQSTSRGG